MACLPLFFAFSPCLSCFCPFVLSFSSLVLLSSCSPALFRGLLPCLASALGLVFLSWLCGLFLGCCFFFPYGIYAKKGAPCWCVLSCPVVGLLYSCVVIKEFRCRCFGLFKFIRFVLPSNTARVGRFARSYFDFLGHNVNITDNRSAFLK